MRNVPVLSVTGLLAAMALLSACGLKGDLERPEPLFGNPPNEGPNDPRSIKAREEALAKQKAEREREAAQRAAQDATNSQPTVMTNTPQ